MAHVVRLGEVLPVLLLNRSYQPHTLFNSQVPYRVLTLACFCPEIS
jgi:hypothetical protein